MNRLINKYGALDHSSKAVQDADAALAVHALIDELKRLEKAIRLRERKNKKGKKMKR